MEDMSRLRETLAKDPQNPRALKGAARYYLREGCYKQSQKLYLQAVGLLPRLLPEIILDYEDEIAQDLEKIGPRLSLAGFLVAEDIDGAVLELEELLELDTPSGRQVEAYNVLGRIYIKQEKIDAAIALLERSIEKGIKDVNLSETLAGAYLEKEGSRMRSGFTKKF
jgi:tetratricopeptide (TPR) repeat protein